MSVWVCVPSKRPVEHVEKWAAAWRERGYGVALWRDKDEGLVGGFANYAIFSEVYPGYAAATNRLVLEVLAETKAQWVVLGGDDVYPDPKHTSDEIADQCEEYFMRNRMSAQPHFEGPHIYETFGVMQPTGDRFGEDAHSIAQYGPNRSAYADRVCCSPWVGREFALRINQGKGPLWPEYFHMFEDEELQAVAEKYGVLWQRRDLTHYHAHWSRARQLTDDMPEFLKDVSSQEHWQKYGLIFKQRQAAGFPGSEPL